MTDDLFIELTPMQMRLLPPSCWKLLRVLFRDRNKHINTREWLDSPDNYFIDLLKSCALRAGIGYSTARYALNLLRKAGVIRTERNIVERTLADTSELWLPHVANADGDLLPLPEGAERLAATVTRVDHVNALERHWYSVIGAWRTVRGVDRVFVPRAAWELFEAEGDGRAASMHRPMQDEIIDWRTVTQAHRSAVSTRRDSLVLSGGSNGLSRQVKPSINKTLYNKVLSSSKEEERNGKAVFDRSSESRSEGEVSEARLIDALCTPEPEDGRDPVSLLGSSCGGVFVARSRLAVSISDNFDPTLVVTPDVPRLEPSTVRCLRYSMTDAEICREVVESYRRAILEVYGQRWFLYRGEGDITKGKSVSKFLAAANAFRDESVPPEHWMIWRLRWNKEHRTQFKSAPPPIWLILSPKFIRTSERWFRSEYVLPTRKFVDGDLLVCQEQHLRNHEAQLIRAGKRRAHWTPGVMTTWYAALRDKEIAAGLTHPLDRWPYLDGTRKSPPVLKYNPAVVEATFRRWEAEATAEENAA